MRALSFLLGLFLVGMCSASCVVHGGETSDHPLSLIGWVYDCTDGGETIELCYGDSEQALEASLAEAFGVPWACRPTTRHIGGCLYRCPPVEGCNATSTCWCPEVAS